MTDSKPSTPPDSREENTASPLPKRIRDIVFERNFIIEEQRRTIEECLEKLKHKDAEIARLKTEHSQLGQQTSRLNHENRASKIIRKISKHS